MTEIWTLPVPSTAFLREPEFQKLFGRTCVLICEYEDEDKDTIVLLRLLFEGVEAFRCTYHTACTVDMVNAAYDRVVDVGHTHWLAEIGAILLESKGGQEELRHLMIYFDDGPCYEFICGSFRTENKKEMF